MALRLPWPWNDFREAGEGLLDERLRQRVQEMVDAFAVSTVGELVRVGLFRRLFLF